jgi:hypothetical protein
LTDFGWVKALAEAMRASGVVTCQYTKDGETVSMTLSPDFVAEPEVFAPFRFEEKPVAPDPRAAKRAKYEEVFGKALTDAELDSLPDAPGVFS